MNTINNPPLLENNKPTLLFILSWLFIGIVVLRPQELVAFMQGWRLIAILTVVLVVLIPL